MAIIITETFELPLHWVVALVNDDTSYMGDREIARLDKFIKHQLEHYEIFNVINYSEPYYSEWHDARDFGELAGQVAECEVQVATMTKGD